MYIKKENHDKEETLKIHTHTRTPCHFSQESKKRVTRNVQWQLSNIPNIHR